MSHRIYCVYSTQQKDVLKKQVLFFLEWPMTVYTDNEFFKSPMSNTRGLITEPSKGNLEVKIITPIPKRQTRPETVSMLWKSKLIFSSACVLTESRHHAFRHCKNFSWLLLDPEVLQNLARGKNIYVPSFWSTCKCGFLVALGYFLN